jgi:myo-inositol-1(or 4)-monophosphatase
MIEALLVTGFPYDVQENPEPYMRVFAAFIARARAVRRLGSAALDLCYVAAGRMDGFWEAQLNPWDTRAGALIVQEAGGRVTGMDGLPWNPAGGHILASNGAIHAAMLETLDKAR